MRSSKKIISFLAVFLAFAGVVSAVPQMEVSPTDLDWRNDTVYVDQGYQVDFTFTNQNDSKKILDVTLEDREWLSWNQSVNGSRVFDLNASENKTVSATISPTRPGLINQTMDVSYRYNDTSGNQSDITYDENYFPQISFLIPGEYRQTNVSTQIFDTNFTVNLSETDSSVFRIENIGNETAYNVDFSGEYVQFNKDSFNISRNKDEFVDFEVKIPKPDDPEKATNMTNRTYQTNIQISGENFEGAVIPLNIEVPYKKYEPETEQNGSVSKVLKEFQTWCMNNPQECNVTETVYQNRTVYVNQTPVYEANFTQDQYNSIVNSTENREQDMEQIREQIQLLKQAMKYKMDRMNQSMYERTGEAINTSEKAYIQAENTEQKVDQEIYQENQREQKASSLGMIIFIASVIIALLIGLGYGLYKLLTTGNDYRLA